jgi:trehalose synthase
MSSVVEVLEVDVPPTPLDLLGPVIGDSRLQRLKVAAARLEPVLGDSTIWNLSSTASGGGVAEMLHVLVGYVRGAGIAIRWGVVQGDPEFFRVTKRLHNRLHGVKGDEGSLGAEEAAHYEGVARANAEALAGRIRRGDVVLLHDPQTAGLAPLLRAAGAQVVWRCHIGTDAQNEWSDEGWDFLRSYLEAASALVFSRPSFAPRRALPQRIHTIAPSIDPLSPKNQPLDEGEVLAIVAKVGLIEADSPLTGAPTFRRRDGTEGKVQRTASVVTDGPMPLDTPLVVQVSRWDRLKDMPGVMRGFVDQVVRRTGAHLALVGPAVEGVTDDPEGAEVFADCLMAWRVLPGSARHRVSLVTLPMQDQEENAAMVNALQRQAQVVTQKSLVEGFGLTVAEAMWKSRPVVASAVGGIVDQVVPGSGSLLADPTDVDAFGVTVAGLLERPDLRRSIGTAARSRIEEHFLGDRHLLQWSALLEDLLSFRHQT